MYVYLHNRPDNILYKIHLYYCYTIITNEIFIINKDTNVMSVVKNYRIIHYKQ